MHGKRGFSGRFWTEHFHNSATRNTKHTEREIERLRTLYDRQLADAYRSLTPWNTVRVARHPKRPQTRDYIEMIGKDFCELHGDRRFGDDPGAGELAAEAAAGDAAAGIPRAAALSGARGFVPRLPELRQHQRLQLTGTSRRRSC